MLQHYIIIAYRNIVRHVSISLATVVGYALTLSILFPVFLLHERRSAFDNFQREDIFRIVTRLQIDGLSFATTPTPLSDYLKENMPGISAVHFLLMREVRISTDRDAANLPFRAAFVDDEFYDDIKLSSGKTESLAHLNPRSIVLTAESAVRLFGVSDPIGKTVTVEGYGEAFVGLVLPAAPAKSHLDFDAYMVASEFGSLLEPAEKTDWNNYHAAFTYIVTGSSYKRLSTDIENLSDQLINENRFNEELGRQIRLDVQRLTTITKDNLYGDTAAVRMIRNPIVFLVCGIILFFLATINYFNLFVTRSLTRAKEAGIRKIYGVGGTQILLQYSIESLIILLFSSLIGVIIMIFLPIDDLRSLLFTSEILSRPVLQYLMFLVGLAIITGLIPFLLLSKINIIKSLKITAGTFRVSGINFQRVLLVIQFSCSLVVLTLLLVFVSQSNYSVDANYGFDAEKVWSIDLQGANGEILEHKVASLADVQLTGQVSDYFGKMPGRIEVRKPQDSVNSQIFHYSVGSNMINLFGLKLLAGTSLSVSANRSEVIINQASLKFLGFDRPEDAINTPLILYDSVSTSIVGVISDFHFDNFKREIRPLILHDTKSHMNHLLIKLGNDGYPHELVQKINEIWKELNPNVPLVFENYLQVFKARQAHSSDIISIAVIGCYMITITLLSLLGITMHHMKYRAKEISIHKIHGASNSDLVSLLAKSFLWLFGISLIIAMPVAYMAANSFLDQFAYRINLTFLLFFIPGSSIFIFAFTIVIIQVLRSASINPITNLRYE